MLQFIAVVLGGATSEAHCSIALTKTMLSIGDALNEIAQTLAASTGASDAWVTGGATMVGALIGGFTVLSANILSFRLRDRKEGRDAVCEYFIDGGISELIGGLTEWRFTVQRETLSDDEKITRIEETRVWPPLVRCEEILGASELSVCVTDLRYFLTQAILKKYVLDQNSSQVFIDLIKVLEHMRTITITKKVSNRAKLHKLRKKSEVLDIKKSFSDIKQRINKMISDMSKSIPRHRAT